MEKTFRKKTITYFTDVAKKNKLLKYPCLAGMSVTLAFYYVGMHLLSNGKRYASMIFVAVFFMSSCSFSFAVFAERTGFTGAQEAYSAIVETSDVSLAVVEPVSPVVKEILEEGNVVSSEHDEDAETYTLDDLLEQHEHGHDTDTYEDYSGTEHVTGTGLSFDNTDWRLVLINKQHPIPDDYDFKLGTFTSGMRCDERVIEDLLLMMQAAKKDGLNLVVRSPYRTSDHQEDNFNDRIKSYMRQGLSYMDAYKATSRVITVPGCSEHEVGLALDITSDTFIPLLQGFADTEEGKWLEEHCHEYGFTLRYPSGKEYITGIEYEPWHFRYVGREAAAIMKAEELCLEEFWDKYL
ncbi:MAG: M15 family metallopeptidase [Lachnospiraceae bacterium]|nr:M15 family metallopeptidase [Lachnospiraceae bacterium]